MIDDILNCLSATSRDLTNYDSRKVDRTEINGVTVSTAYTSDYGYETAIIDENGVHPVERYGSDRKAAICGHDNWKAKAETAEKIIKLGYGSIVSNCKITLKRKLAHS